MLFTVQERKLESHFAKVGKFSEEKLVEIFEEIHYSEGYVLLNEKPTPCLIRFCFYFAAKLRAPHSGAA